MSKNIYIDINDRRWILAQFWSYYLVHVCVHKRNFSAGMLGENIYQMKRAIDCYAKAILGCWTIENILTVRFMLFNN
jgi:hypothetical protein